MDQSSHNYKGRQVDFGGSSSMIDMARLKNENQSIRIVPSISDVIKGIDPSFTTTLNVETEQWLKCLKQAWTTWKKGAPVHNCLQQYFCNVSKPFDTVLPIIINHCDFKDAKSKTLPFYIIEELKLWSQSNQHILPSEDTKLIAFIIAMEQKSTQFIKLMIDVYQIGTVKSKVMPLLKNILQEGNFSNSYQSIVSMQLFEHITIEDLLIPLILQDKMGLVEEYLSRYPRHAKPLVLYLDRLLDKKTSLRSILQDFISEHHIWDVKWEKLSRRTLGKLIARLCNKNKVSLDICTNLNIHRATGGLRFLLAQKYQENKLSDGAWEDLVRDLINRNLDSLEVFIDVVSEYDAKEALRWAQSFELSPEKYPPNVSDLLDTDHASSDVTQLAEELEDWDLQASSMQYYVLNLPLTSLKMVNDEETFYDFLYVGMSNQNLIGIDAEWKPCFGATKIKVALIQIATIEFVYFIDAITLNAPQYTGFWQKFVMIVLDNPNILKIGFGLDHDLKEIKSSIVSLSNLNLRSDSYLEMSTMWKNLLKLKVTLPYQNDSVGGSLSVLVEHCFGRCLDKQEQCSNWEIRPLRKSQIVYAALDAFVLIEIFTLFQNLCMEKGINFEQIFYDVKIDKKMLKCKRKKPQLKANGPPNVPIGVKQIKLFVDERLHSDVILGLRDCGIDTETMLCTTPWEDTLAHAQCNGRHIVVPWKKFKKNVILPTVWVCEVNTTLDQEPLLQVLKFFHIKVTNENLFSRCEVCNGDELVHIRKEDLKDMLKDFNKVNSSIPEEDVASPAPQCSYKPNRSYEDDFDAFLSEDEESDGEICVAVKASNNQSFKTNTYQRVYPDICRTKYGVNIDITSIPEWLFTSDDKSVTLCHKCGKLHWDGNQISHLFYNGFIKNIPTMC